MLSLKVQGAVICSHSLGDVDVRAEWLDGTGLWCHLGSPEVKRNELSSSLGAPGKHGIIVLDSSDTHSITLAQPSLIISKM